MESKIIINNSFLNLPYTENENVIILDCEIVSGEVKATDLILIEDFKISVMKTEKQLVNSNKMNLYVKLESDNIKIRNYFGCEFTVISKPNF